MNRLTVNSITSIGAVEDGDNEPSKIMFWKRKKDTEPVQGQVEKEGEPMSFDVDSLPDEAKEYMTAQIAAGIAEASEEVPDALPDDLPDLVTKRIEDDADLIEKERVEKDALLKRITTLEDGIATEKYEARAAKLAVLFPAEELAPVLKALATADPEAFGKLDAMFDTLIVKDAMAPLFKELGDTSSGGPAIDQISAYATEIRKNNSDLSPAEAKAQAWRDHPDLVAQSREEGN
jgi:hypothetical protein